MTFDCYVVLTCTAHGTPVWRTASDPDLVDVDRDSPRRVLGPFLVGPEGYPTEEEGADEVASAEGIDLGLPHTWFSADDWAAHYAATGEHPDA